MPVRRWSVSPVGGQAVQPLPQEDLRDSGGGGFGRGRVEQGARRSGETRFRYGRLPVGLGGDLGVWRCAELRRCRAGVLRRYGQEGGPGLRGDGEVGGVRGLGVADVDGGGVGGYFEAVAAFIAAVA